MYYKQLQLSGCLKCINFNWYWSKATQSGIKPSAQYNETEQTEMSRISGKWRKSLRALMNEVEQNNVPGDFINSFVMWWNSTNTVSYLEFV